MSESSVNSIELIKKIGLGTVQFGADYGVSNTAGKTPKEEVIKVLEYAQQKGISVLDTASAYGNAEEVLGENNLEQFNVVSKFILGKDRKPIEGQLTESLKKLNLSSIYGYLAHRPLNVIENKTVWEFLEKSKTKGKIKKIGFSFNEVDELTKVMKTGFIPDLIQVPYNYFDQRFENHIIDLKAKGCEIHTRSTFLQGLFFCNPNELHSHFDEVKETLDELQKHEGKLPALLLKWVLNNKLIDKVIIGVNNLQQFKYNLNAVEKELQNLESFKDKVSNNILIPSRWPKK